MGRGQIGRVKYLALGRGKPGQGHGGGGGGRVHIPQSVIKTGVKLPQLQSGGVRNQQQVDKVGGAISCADRKLPFINLH